MNGNYREINVSAQEKDPDSLLNFYRRAIAIRKELRVVRDGDYVDHTPRSGSLFVYSRNLRDEHLLVVCSFAERPLRFRAPSGFDLRRGEILLGNYSDYIESNGFTTKPYECRVYRFPPT